MKKIIIIILGLLLINSLYSQVVYTDSLIDRFSNGQISSILYSGPKDTLMGDIMFSRNKKIVFYYPSGALNTINTYSENNTFSHISWFENGNKENIRYSKNTKSEGIEQTWYENGVLKEQISWKNDKKEGLNYFWNKKGELSSITSYKNNLRDGLSVSFWNGISRTEFYKKDVLDGYILLYDKNNKLVVSASYKNGLFDGKQYSIDNKFIKKGYFKEGSGIDTIFYKKGKLTEIRYYSFKGTLILADTVKCFPKEYIIKMNLSYHPDTIKDFDKNGRILFVGYQNENHDMKKEYYKKGVKIKIVYIENGTFLYKSEYLRNGFWETEYYDESGFMYRKTTKSGDIYFKKKE